MAKDKKRYKRRGRRSKTRGFASWSLGKKIGAILGGTLVTVAAIGAVIVASKLSKINTVKLDTDKLSVSKEAKKRGSGYLNVALFGVDSRDNDLDKGTRSDTIMIASLNKKTMKVKIASIYRDTLSEQEDGTLNKINAAYSYGGPEGALSVLNKNLDMNIEHYITVNFNSMIDVVDSVGGIDIDVQEDEMPYICGYVQEIMKVTGKLSPGVTEPGTQTLNGVQATAYARIRYTAGDDFKRAERQRAVLQKVVEKLQQASPAQLNKIIDKVFPEVSTNFTMTEILEYAKDAFDYELGETTGFPFDKTTDTLGNVGSVVIPVTMESNVKQLHSFFYGESDNYDVSSTVSGISAKIEKKPETEMRIQTNQRRSLCNSRKRHIPETVEQQRTVREVQEQPEALRTDRERVVTVVLREVQGQRAVQPEAQLEQVREVVHQPEQEAEQQEVQERQEMVHQREILQPGQAENQLAAKVPRSRTP